MMDTAAARDVMTNSLRAAGFVGRGTVWRLRGSGVRWVVHIDHLPYGNRLGVDIGLDLQVESTPTLPTACPILLHLENLRPSDRSAIVQALDLDSHLDDAQRRDVLERAMQALGSYLGERLTLGSVRDAYRSGEFGSGYIHKDARALLEAELPAG